MHAEEASYSISDKASTAPHKILYSRSYNSFFFLVREVVLPREVDLALVVVEEVTLARPRLGASFIDVAMKA